MRKAMPADLKLAPILQLHHLTEGSTHSVIAAHYRLGRSTVSNNLRHMHCTVKSFAAHLCEATIQCC